MNTFNIGAVALILVGFYGLFSRKDLFKMLISLNIVESGVNLFLISTGYRENGIAPILSAKYPFSSLSFVDPLPQALVLTSIVIGLAVTAFALFLIIKIYLKFGTLDISKLSDFGGGEEI